MHPIFVLAFFSLINTLSTSDSTLNALGRVVEWLCPMTHDFGPIERDQPVEYTFRFRNISKDSIIIDNVRPACGCTALDWDDSPVAPDSIGQLHIKYDARHKGEFRKRITVFFSGQKKGDRIFVEGETF